MKEPGEQEKGKIPARKEHPKWGRTVRAILIVIVVLAAGTVTCLLLLPVVQEKTAQVLYSTAREWRVASRDFFDDWQNLTYWTSTDGTTSGLITSFGSVNERLEITVAPTRNVIVREAFFNEHALAAGDFLLTMELQVPLPCATGLIFRGDILGEYYLFLVTNDRYDVEILRREGARDQPREAIIPNAPIPAELIPPYSLGVLAHEDDYSFYINQVLVTTMSDSRLRGERTGIEIVVCQGAESESVFHIDNFTLRVPQAEGTR